MENSLVRSRQQFLWHGWNLSFERNKCFATAFPPITKSVFLPFGFELFGRAAPIATFLADKYPRRLLMVIFHFGIGISPIAGGLSSGTLQFATAIGSMGLFASIYH